MKILLTHNFYKISGGEDSVFHNEKVLLETGGNSVSLYTIDNDQVVSISDKILTAISVPFSFNQYRKFKKHLLLHKPNVVHVHNYFPLYSPSIFYACKSAGIPVVHTLHNYRAVCPTALLMHNGTVNERSVKGSSLWSVTKKVYRNSLIGSLTLAVMVDLHKLMDTWKLKVDCYIALTEFSKQKYIEAGWPNKKIAVKSNFIADPIGITDIANKKGNYGLFIGRLSEEKGINTLLNAWTSVTEELNIVGDGPLQTLIEKESTGNIRFLGRKDKRDVLELVKNANFVLLPSTCYEGFPMVLVEAFACGTPVLVSRLGSMKEIVEDGVTGLHFETGNANDLATKAQWLINNPERTRQMGQNARNEYLAKYTPEKNYEMLMNIYQQAIDEAKKTR